MGSGMGVKVGYGACPIFKVVIFLRIWTILKSSITLQSAGHECCMDKVIGPGN